MKLRRARWDRELERAWVGWRQGEASRSGERRSHRDGVGHRSGLEADAGGVVGKHRLSGIRRDCEGNRGTAGRELYCRIGAESLRVLADSQRAGHSHRVRRFQRHGDRRLLERRRYTAALERVIG